MAMSLWPQVLVNPVNAVAKFSNSRAHEKVPEESTLIFVHTWTSLKHSIGLVERNLHTKKTDQSVRPFRQNTTCDRETQMDRQTRVHK